MTEYTPEKVAEPTDIDALEAVAKAATQQEPWKVTDLRDDPQGNRDCIWIDTDSTSTYATIAEMNDTDGLYPVWGIEDAKHIATFDPPTVLALIAELRQERAKVRGLWFALEGTQADRDRLHKAITEALAFESVLPVIATEPRRILRAALDKGRDDDE